MNPFGNDPAKIAGYKAFWACENVKRPLVGFSIKSWFPLEEFEASRAWQSETVLTPDMVQPDAFLDDQERLLSEGETMGDDILRGASPSQAVFWLCGMLGATLRILPGNTLGEEQPISWEEIMQMRLDRENHWFQKYIEFAQALAKRADGRFPVSHGTLIGPTDLLAVFRGHTRSLIDLIEAPEQVREALWKFANIFRDVTEAVWEHIPRFEDGYFDAQYQLWGAESIIRMQEDAIAVYSPKLYRKFVQPIDRYLAQHFGGSFMHLHSTSMFILDAFLEIDELRCFEINYEVDSGGPEMAGMLPHFQRVQQSGRSLIIRGSFTPDEARQMIDLLDPRGLYIYVMVSDMAEADQLRPILGL